MYMVPFPRNRAHSQTHTHTETLLSYGQIADKQIDRRYTSTLNSYFQGLHQLNRQNLQPETGRLGFEAHRSLKTLVKKQLLVYVKSVACAMSYMLYVKAIPLEVLSKSGVLATCQKSKIAMTSSQRTILTQERSPDFRQRVFPKCIAEIDFRALALQIKCYIRSPAQV